MLGLRVLTAAVWVPVHLAILVWGRPYHFLLYLEAIALIAGLEMFNLAEAGGRRPHRLLVLAAGATYLAAVAYRPAWAAGAVLALALGSLVVPLFRRSPAGALGDAGASLLSFGYGAGLLGFLMLVRRLGAGVNLLVLFFVTIWLVDIAAYFVGRGFGRHKLAPRLSPGKTAEGSIGGLVVGVAAPVGVTLLWPGVGLAWWEAAAVGVVLAAGTVLGDLAESALKRDAGVKDTGGLLPGHGGVLDRFDAVLFCAPLYYGLLLLLGHAR
jgi:phosphatidate cytidylyltransferase